MEKKETSLKGNETPKKEMKNRKAGMNGRPKESKEKKKSSAAAQLFKSNFMLSAYDEGTV
jgi:hypothetical protein